MKINKWTHVYVIQNHCDTSWEDESEYDDRKQARADFKEYLFTGYPYRMIKRRVINPEWEKAQTLSATTQEEARQHAIDWQNRNAPMSWLDVLEWQGVFTTLAEKFDLLEEFKENGIL